MNCLLRNITFGQCFVYIYNIFVFGETEEECVKRTKNVLDHAFADGQKLGGLKNQFLLTKVDVIGFAIVDCFLTVKNFRGCTI